MDAVLDELEECVSGKDDIEPVSYTHLDVYKRQVLHLDCL